MQKKSLLQLFQILLSGCWDFLPEVLNTLHQSLPLFFILESVDILCCHVAASLGNIVDDNEAAGKLLKSPEVGWEVPWWTRSQKPVLWAHHVKQVKHQPGLRSNEILNVGPCPRCNVWEDWFSTGNRNPLSLVEPPCHRLLAGGLQLRVKQCQHHHLLGEVPKMVVEASAHSPEHLGVNFSEHI